MYKIDYGKRLIEGMEDKFRAIEDFNVYELLELDDDLSLAYLMSYMALTKDEILKKTKEYTHPIGRLERYVKEEDLNKVFEGVKAPIIYLPKKEELKDLIKEMCPNTAIDDLDDSDYRLWIFDTIRDSIMHESVDVDDDLGYVFLENTLPNRKLKGLIPFDWFRECFDMNLVDKREFDSYSIKGFYYNPEEEASKFHLSDELFDKTILYKVNIDCNGKKINEREITEFISNKFLEYSNVEVTDEEIEEFNRFVLRRELDIPEKYLVAFCKAKEQVEKALLEKYPGIIVKIRIDNNKEMYRERVNNDLLEDYLNYQDLYDDLNSLLIDDGKKQIDAMRRFYEFVLKYQNDEELRSKSFVDLRNELIHDITLNNGIYSDDELVYEKRIKEAQQMLKIIFYYVYGISTIVMNDKKIDDKDYLQFLEDTCETGKKQKYIEYMDRLRKLEKDYTDLLDKWEIGKNNYLNVLDKSGVSEETKDKLRDFFVGNMINLYFKRKDLENALSFVPFYKDDEHLLHEEELQDLKDQILANIHVLIDVGGTSEEKKEIVSALSEIQKDLMDIEEGFTYGKCSGEEVKEILRNCLSHPGRITFDSLGSSELTIRDYKENGKTAVEINVPVDLFPVIISRSMEQFRDNKQLIRK